MNVGVLKKNYSYIDVLNILAIFFCFNVAYLTSNFYGKGWDVTFLTSQNVPRNSNSSRIFILHDIWSDVN
ncbi:hypothetical protein ATW79_09730 [Oenococcus oeni]|nr:hypothetical protein ATW79_09730 [Oenococcus oeni]OIL10616.1 hypothetical protein ATW92_00535 [Oenococcus oeni]OIL11344.1 hypothetical protein ATW93_09375 [Oenococcus oeni]